MYVNVAATKRLGPAGEHVKNKKPPYLPRHCDITTIMNQYNIIEPGLLLLEVFFLDVHTYIHCV